jgi:cation:H+ antiporter
MLVVLLALYLAFSVWLGRRSQATGVPQAGLTETGLTETGLTGAQAEGPTDLMSGSFPRARAAGLFLVGLVALVAGASLLVDGATGIAAAFGVPDLVIGLTVVAIGTSLPELITSAIAALRGHRDIAVGNVMGSNLFNILGILGITALVGGGLPVAEQVRTFDLAIMTIVAFACLPLLFTGWELRRWEGALFVGYAVLYTTYVVLAALRHPLVAPLEFVTVVFALPLTAIVLVSVTLREFGRGSSLRRWFRDRPGRQAG